MTFLKGLTLTSPHSLQPLIAGDIPPPIIRQTQIDLALGMRLFVDRGGWTFSGAWNTSQEIASAVLLSIATSGETPIRATRLYGRDLYQNADFPPNGTYNALASRLRASLPTGTYRIKITVKTTGLELPGIGGPPARIYVAGSARFWQDGKLNWSRTFSPGAGDHTLEDTLNILAP